MGDPAKRLVVRDGVSPHSCTHVASTYYLGAGVFLDLSGSMVILGTGVELNDGVRVLTHNHRFRDAGWRELGEVETDRPTVIDDYAFVGINAIITHACKHVGKHSVIGAGSVVTKDVPDYEIWAGNPAVKIGEVTETI